MGGGVGVGGWVDSEVGLGGVGRCVCGGGGGSVCVCVCV